MALPRPLSERARCRSSTARSLTGRKPADAAAACARDDRHTVLRSRRQAVASKAPQGSRDGQPGRGCVGGSLPTVSTPPSETPIQPLTSDPDDPRGRHRNRPLDTPVDGGRGKPSGASAGPLSGALDTSAGPMACTCRPPLRNPLAFRRGPIERPYGDPSTCPRATVGTPMATLGGALTTPAVDRSDAPYGPSAGPVKNHSRGARAGLRWHRSAGSAGTSRRLAKGPLAGSSAVSAGGRSADSGTTRRCAQRDPRPAPRQLRRGPIGPCVRTPRQAP
jgi:hypothetical protein